MTAPPRRTAPADVFNPFWPYDTDRSPADQPGSGDPPHFPVWRQHARLGPALRAAARAALDPPSERRRGMSQTGAAASPDAVAGVRALADVLDGAEVTLGAFTDEELAAVAPVELYPMARYAQVDLVAEELRTPVLTTALRSLIARDLVRLRAEPGELEAVGSLGTVLALCGAPSWVVTVDRIAEFDPSWRQLYGVVVDGVELVLEEALAPLGQHVFTLRSAAAEAAALAAWLRTVPGWATAEATGPGAVDLSAADEDVREAVAGVLEQALSLGRVHALRSEADGDYTAIDAVVVHGADGEQLVVVFTGDGDDGGERMAVVPTSAVPLETFFSGVLAFDLGAVSAALPA